MSSWELPKPKNKTNMKTKLRYGKQERLHSVPSKYTLRHGVVSNEQHVKEPQFSGLLGTQVAFERRARTVPRDENILSVAAVDAALVGTRVTVSRAAADASSRA